MPLGDGPVVGYSEVEVWHGENGEFGKDRHQFRSARDAPDAPFSQPWLRQTSFAWKRGQDRQIWVDDASGHRQRETYTSHAFHDEDPGGGDPSTTRRFPAVSIVTYETGPGAPQGYVGGFQVVSAWWHPSSETTIIRDDAGTSISTTRDWVYGGPTSAMLTSSMLSASGLSAFNSTAAVNRQYNDLGWHTDNSATGAWLRVDLGAGVARRFTVCRVFINENKTGTAVWDVEYGDNGTTWTKAVTGFKPTAGGPSGTFYAVAWPDVGAHRYWRLLLTNTPGPGAWNSELEFWEPGHLQLSELTETNSDGTQRITRMKYPLDYPAAPGTSDPAAAALTGMQDAHIHNAVVERWVIERAGGVALQVETGRRRTILAPARLA